ncbi:MAG: response regulator [Deltaproteobacteria bacterium]|nr:response regulator [Deltaproteobacteria bacterium]
MRIVLADDEPVLRMVLCRLLDAHGAEVVAAADGIELLERLAEATYDLIVTDVDMGWFGGIPALAAARTAGVTTPALVMSGDLGKRARDLRHLGRVRLLDKPFDPAAMFAMIDDLLHGAGASGNTTATAMPWGRAASSAQLPP